MFVSYAVACSCAVADIWMMIYVIFARVSCSCPGSVPLCVDIILFMLYSLYSLSYVQVCNFGSRVLL